MSRYRPQGLPAAGSLSRPAHFTRCRIPLTVVCGPPGAGKSTYVRENAGASDLVICFDQIATELFGRPSEVRTAAGLTPAQIFAVLRERNEMIERLMGSGSYHWRRAWMILTEPLAENRQWWADRTGALVVVLATPADVCKARIAADAGAGDRRGDNIPDLVDAWWREYRPAGCDRAL